MNTFDALINLPQNRRWHQQAYPVASVLALIRRDGVLDDGKIVARYLLIQRRTEPYIGKWGLVGGRWEFGETLAAAITREVKEETGLDATFVGLRGLVNERIAPSGPSEIGAHYLLFVCELSSRTGLAHEQSEGPVAWFSPRDVDELHANETIIATDYAILRRFSQDDEELSYIEVEVLASSGENARDELVRFTQGP